MQLCAGGDLQKHVEVGASVQRESVFALGPDCLLSVLRTEGVKSHAADTTAASQVYGALDEASLAAVAFEVLKIIKSCHDMGIIHGARGLACFAYSVTAPQFGAATERLGPTCRRYQASQLLHERRAEKPWLRSVERVSDAPTGTARH